jgi:hypothetical protein
MTVPLSNAQKINFDVRLISCLLLTPFAMTTHIFMKLVRCFFSLVIGTSLCLTQVQAQYFPDTTLRYADFLKQCQEFSRKPQSSAWVVMYWASFNSASLSMATDLKAMVNEFPNEPIRFVFISVDNRRSSWEQRLRAFELPGEHLFLPDETDYEFLRRAFRHNSIPALYLVYPNADIQRQRSVTDLRSQLIALAPSLQDRPMANVPMDDFSGSSNNQGDEVEFAMDPDRNPSSTPRNDPGPDNQEAQGTSLLHTVRKGDTLYSIARQYNAAVADIKSANNLSGSLISVGQKLLIPQ